MLAIALVPNEDEETIYYVIVDDTEYQLPQGLTLSNCSYYLGGCI